MTAGKEKVAFWAPAIAVFVGLFLWSLHAYLTVRFNSDIIVEAIGVQDLMRDLSWVWSYPGQLHGGVVEYPIIALGELIAPGNPYGFTFIRIFYVPVTGVLLAVSVRRAFPSVNLWWFAAAAAAGPALLHDFRAISDIYPFGWLLAAIGVYLVAGKRFLFIGGVFLGLGVYEHASAALMALPLVLAIAVRFVFEIRRWVRIALGIVIGLIPMALAQFTQGDKIVVWSPAKLEFPRAIGLLGLSDSGAGWPTSMLPGAWGIQDGGTAFLGVGIGVQFYLNLALIVGLLVFVVVGVVLILRGRSSWKSPLGFLVITWISGLALALGLSAVVQTVWFYGLSLGFLVWVTAALGGRLVAIPIVAVMGAMSIYSVSVIGGVVDSISLKWDQQQEISGVAQSLIDNNVTVIFGDYWEILPVAYASAGEVHPITASFNRLPLPIEVVESPDVLVGVSSGTIALPSGRESWDSSTAVSGLVSKSCRFISPLPGNYSDLVSLYQCPRDILVKGIG
ncbi:MAG: hypothetical protein OSA11_00900 [Candidatus Nanopelagicales bacterium]|nr:hypothetical protein [Candidatus Nanopelagicales bacterium]